MAAPVIVYNATSGSDTAASGAGPATAVTGTGASGTSGGSTIDLSADSPDLSGVAADDMIWVNTSSGQRHLYKITAVNDTTDVVTVSPSLGTTFSSTSWAIGGKRKTLENDSSQKDWEDQQNGWIYEFEAGTYTITAAIGITTGALQGDPTTFRAASGASPTIDTTTSNVPCFNATGSPVHTVIQGLNLRSAGSSSSLSYGIQAVNWNIHMKVIDCDIETRGQVWSDSSSLARSHISFDGCRFDGTSSSTTRWATSCGTYNKFHFQGCLFEGGGSGYPMQDNSSSDFRWMEFVSCAFIDGWNLVSWTENSADWIKRSFTNCIFEDGNRGINVGGSWNDREHVVVRNCIFSNNTTGFYATANWDPAGNAWLDYNAYYNNTTDRNNVPTGDNDVALTASPYVGSGDYSLNATAGGGADCENAGIGRNS